MVEASQAKKTASERPELNGPSNFEQSPWRTPVKAVIFDMDGVMIDSAPLDRLAFNTIFNQFGAELTEDEYVTQYVGLSEQEVARKIIANHKFIDTNGVTLTQEKLMAIKGDIYRKLLVENASDYMMPGLPELLQELRERGFLLAVASGSTKQDIAIILKALQVESFFGEHYYSVEEVPRGKPHPDVFSYAARKLRRFGIKNNSECLVLEDTDIGLRAAAKARMHRYAIPSRETTGRTVYPNGYRVLHRGLAEVLDCLEEDSPDSFRKKDTKEI